MIIMAWVPKVNRHVQLLKFLSPGRIKIVPGVIIGFANAPDNNPIIRVGRHDTDPGTAGKQYEIYGNSTTGVPRRTDVNEDLTQTKYISY